MMHALARTKLISRNSIICGVHRSFSSSGVLKSSVRGIHSEYSGDGSKLSPRSLVCKTVEDIENLGARLSSVTCIGDVLLLRGDLGAGKTTLARGLIRHKFSDDTMRVTSPSYLLDNLYEYDEDRFIHHMDLYRLPTQSDLTMLGIPEIFSSSLCIIEWPQRMGDKLPPDYLDIDMSIGNDETRYIKLTASSPRWSLKLDELQL